MTAIATGSAVIAATSEGVEASVGVSVAPVAVASVRVAAPTTTFVAGEASQYTAQETDAQGGVLADRTATWNSSQPTVASVSTTGLVTALATGTTGITATSEGIASPPITITVGGDQALTDERVLAQQGLAVALASTVLQSQLYTMISLAIQADDNGCTALPGGGALKYLSSTSGIPFQIALYFDTSCARIYMNETVTSFADDGHGNYHILASAQYTDPNGIALGSITFNESANNIVLGGGTFASGTINGLGTYAPAAGSATVQLGLNCDIGASGHNIGVCQGGIAQDFPGLGASYGSVATLQVDSANTGVVSFTGSSVLTSGALGALTLDQPSPTVMIVNGGSTYGTTADGGGAANFFALPADSNGMECHGHRPRSDAHDQCD